jgi:hypothetical protein
LASQQHTIRSFERKFDPGSIITAEHLRVFADGERANESCCQAGSLFDCKGQCKWKWSTKSATAGKKSPEIKFTTLGAWRKKLCKTCTTAPLTSPESVKKLKMTASPLKKERNF